MANNEILPDTLNMAWFGGNNNQKAVDSLDLVGADTAAVQSLEGLNPAYEQSFGLFGGPTNLFTDIDVEEEEGMLSDIDISQSTMDKLTPAIAIGVGEILTKAGDFRLPAGLKPKIRAGGAKGVAFTLAVRANKIGYDFAREGLGMTETGATMTGGAAAYGAWKGIPAIAHHIGSNIKIGMASQVVTATAIEAGESAVREVTEQGGEKLLKSFVEGKKFVRHLPSEVNVKTAARLMKNHVQQEVSKQVAGEVKKSMGKAAAQGWDDVTKRLLNPTVAARVGKFLAKSAPTIAAKLAISSTAVVIPETVSTLLGVGGIIWTAYDIMNLAKQMPQLMSLIFEDDPEASVEDTVMNEMTATDNMFTPGEQPRTD